MNRLLILFGLASLVLAIGQIKPIQTNAATTEYSLQISELMPDPSKVSDANGEWVEIKNNGDAVELIDFKIAGKQFSANINASDSLIICKNSEQTANGGVDCDLQLPISLTNSGKTIELLDANDNLVDSLTYESSNVSVGHSIHRDLSIEDNYTYGLGDFGQPDKNIFGAVIVHSVLEKNNNLTPDLFGSETLTSGMIVNLYNDDGSIRNTKVTTGENWPNSSFFATTPGEYEICMEIDSTSQFPTFAKKSLSYLSYDDTQSSISEDLNCAQIEVLDTQIASQYFGYKTKIDGPAQVRVHVVDDSVGVGSWEPQIDTKISGHIIRLYDDTGMVQEIESNNFSYFGSAKFELNDVSKNWHVCIEKPDNYQQTFVTKIQSWTQYSEIDQVFETTENNAQNCAQIKIFDGQVESIVLGINEI